MTGSTGIAYERVTRALTAKAAAGGWEPPGEGGDWRCPAHDDHNPSLSVTNGDGKVKLHCHANCSVNDVVDALGLKLKDLFDKAGERHDRPQIAATYNYTDANGDLAYQAVRFTPKTFRQRRPDGKGGWIWNLQDTPRVLYHLPDVIIAVKEDLPIYVVEGEKDADALVRAGVVATCNPGGAGKWRSEYTDTLKGAAEIIVVADRDQPGYDHARQVAQALRPHVAKVVVVEAAEGKDVTDHLAAGRQLDELQKITNQVVEPAGDDQTESGNPFAVAWIADVARRVDSAPNVGWLAQPVWPADAYGVIAAPKKAGKTWIGLDLAVSVASGTSWLGRFDCHQPGTVLVFLGEGGERKMLRRLRAIAGARALDADTMPVRMSFRVPSLSSANHLERIATELDTHPAALVIVDPLYLAAAGAKSSDLYAMGAVLTGLQTLCQTHGAALAIITHWNKTGEGSGSHRITGAGPAEWGRILVSFSVEHRATNPDRSTTVTLRLGFEGDEIPELDLRVRRHVAADNPDDLASPLTYTVEVFDADTTPTPDGLRPAEQRVLDVLQTSDDWLDARTIGDQLAVDQTGYAPLKKRTIQAALKTLVERGAAHASGNPNTAHKWRAHPAENEAINAP